MTTTGKLLTLARDFQSLALVGENIKVAKKGLKSKKTLKTKKIVGTGIKNIIGIDLIKAQAQLSSGL